MKCKDTENQLSDRNLVIGEAARKSPDKVQPEYRKMLLQGAYIRESLSHLQLRLPLDSTLLGDLSFHNPAKRQKSNSTTAVQNATKKMVPHCVDLP